MQYQTVDTELLAETGPEAGHWTIGKKKNLPA
jgi:hypothetical protein